MQIAQPLNSIEHGQCTKGLDLPEPAQRRVHGLFKGLLTIARAKTISTQYSANAWRLSTCKPPYSSPIRPC